MKLFQFLGQAVAKAAVSYAEGKLTHQNVSVGNALISGVSQQAHTDNPQTFAEQIAAFVVPMVAPHQPSTEPASQLPEGLDPHSVAVGAAFMLARLSQRGSV